MALLKIAKLGNPLLRERAREVRPGELAEASTQRLIDDLIETMRDANGVGIAAPQVHVGLRIAVAELRGDNPRYPEAPKVPLIVFVNPEVHVSGDAQEEGWEGCLSVDNLRGLVPRFSHLRMRYLDREGNERELEAEGFFARIIQHELDHLNGRLFIDRADTTSLAHEREWQRLLQR